MKKYVSILALSFFVKLSFAQLCLVGKYDFNGNANDLAGTNNGTVNGAQLTYDRFGNINKAYKFNGTGANIFFNANPIAADMPYTISLWVLLDSSYNNIPFITPGYTGNNTPNELSFGLIAKNVLGVQNYPNNTISSDGFLLDTNRWMHVAVTHSIGNADTSYTFYINGFQVSNPNLKSGTAPVYPLNNTMALGALLGTGTQKFLKGSLDDVRIFNCKLNVSQIDSIYQAEASYCNFVVAVNPTNNLCFGELKGSASVVEVVKQNTLQYNWSSNDTGKVVNNLAAGNYYVIIIDGQAECIDTAFFTITQPAKINVTPNVNPASCSDSSGSVTVSVSGGITPYNYLWSNGDTGPTADSLWAGVFLVDVKDANNCLVSKAVYVTSVNAPAVVLTAKKDIDCFNAKNGDITVGVSGGASPYSLLWSNGATTATITNLQPGPYDLVVTDANGCKALFSTSIAQPAKLVAKHYMSISSCAVPDGFDSVAVSGGVQPYSYMWSANAGSQTAIKAINLSAGMYTVTITDANNCTLNSPVTVASFSNHFIQLDNIDTATCGTNNGMIDISVWGGSSNYSHSWNTGATTEDMVNAGAGSYAVMVMDLNDNCLTAETYTVPSKTAIFKPTLCVSTVDTATNNPVLVWENPAFPGVQEYLIYRETSWPNVYQYVGVVPADSQAVFTDTTANAGIHAWKYKISAMDSCGEETGISIVVHRPFYLNTTLINNSVVKLNWTNMLGKTYSKVYVWRKDGASNWKKIDSVLFSANPNNIYYDMNPPLGSFEYFLEANVSSCDPNRIGVNTSKSNIKNMSRTGATGLLPLNEGVSAIVYPNPAAGEVNIKIELNEYRVLQLEIHDAAGRLMYKETVKGKNALHTISTSGFESGLYFISLKGEQINKHLRFSVLK